MIDTAIIYAAGFGKRLGEITQNIPKPLVEINKKPLLYYALELAMEYPFKRIIVNSHYMAEKIHIAVAKFKGLYDPNNIIEIFHEENILETGGTIRAIAKNLDNKIIATINSDTIISSSSGLLSNMIGRYDPKTMTSLMLVQDLSRAIGFHGKSEFELDINMKMIKSIKGEYIYAGTQILNAEDIVQDEREYFSMGEYFKNTNYLNHCYGYINPGRWMHITKAEDIKTIESFLSRGSA